MTYFLGWLYGNIFCSVIVLLIGWRAGVVKERQRQEDMRRTLIRLDFEVAREPSLTAYAAREREIEDRGVEARRRIAQAYIGGVDARIAARERA